MIGILICVLSAACLELSSSLGKEEVRRHIATYYSIAVLNALIAVLFLIGYGFLHGGFVFRLASLPTFIPRLLLEILLVHTTMRALIASNRSDFALVKTLTLPLLLMVDYFIGYTLTLPQVGGVALIIGAMAVLISLQKKRIKGLGFLMVSACIAVGTISLFKYDITHFNSLAAEQGIVLTAIAVYFSCLALWRHKENPFRLLRNSTVSMQTIASGGAHVFVSMAYLYAPAVVITAALRSFMVLFAIISGKMYFHEKHLRLKIILAGVIMIALCLLAYGS